MQMVKFKRSSLLLQRYSIMYLDHLLACYTNVAPGVTAIASKKNTSDSFWGRVPWFSKASTPGLLCSSVRHKNTEKGGGHRCIYLHINYGFTCSSNRLQLSKEERRKGTPNFSKKALVTRTNPRPWRMYGCMLKICCLRGRI